MSGVTSTFFNDFTITGGNIGDYSGTFSCTVSNSRGPSSQSLDIHNILVSGNDVFHNLTSSVDITCSSDLDVQSIRWLDLLTGQELFSNVGQQQLVLPIENVMLELDNIMYTCEVTVMLATGPATIMETITFRVNNVLAPRVPEMVRNISITSSSVTIQWTVMGDFNADSTEDFVVMYGRSSGELSMSTSAVIIANSDTQTYSTQLNSLEPGTVYYYKVVARNRFATRMTDEMSFITDDLTSSEVSDLQLDSLNDTTLLISWGEPASPNGNILSYSINITNLKDGSTVRNADTEATDSLSYTENNLEPGVPYSVCVTAVNRAGLGEFITVIVFTRELSPSIAPRNVRITRTSATVMVVSWQPLNLSEARGFISHYTVTYSPQIISSGRKRQAAMTQIVEGMDANTTRIEDLDPNTDYSVQVSASTGAGDGELSVVISVPIKVSGGVDTGAIVGGVTVVVVILIVAITAVVIAALFLRERHRKETHAQQDNVASKEVEGIEGHIYNTVNDAPEYEVIDNKAGGSVLPPKAREDFTLKECPAYVPTTAKRSRDGGNVNDATYEMVSST